MNIKVKIKTNMKIYNCKKERGLIVRTQQKYRNKCSGTGRTATRNTILQLSTHCTNSVPLNSHAQNFETLLIYYANSVLF